MAYVAPATAVGDDGRTLRERLAHDLPEHMVPAVFVGVEALPRTANGKVDREALARLGAPTGAPASESNATDQPVGAIEEALAAIWRDVLDVPSVGRHQSFFDLGGHSLSAMRMVLMIERELGPALSIETLFLSPTVAELRAALEETGSALRTDS